MADLWHLLIAIACGGIVGMERELRRKPAGLRTNMLISFGAALFTIGSIRIDLERGDPARVAAQIVTGIGFLGAGAIIHHGQDTISGLTSAATIWVVAALGMLAGASHAGLAVVGALLTVGVLTMIDHVERYVDEQFERHYLRVEIRKGAGIGNRVRRELRGRHVCVESIEFKPGAEQQMSMSVVYSTTAAAREGLLERLRRLDGVLALEDVAE